MIAGDYSIQNWSVYQEFNQSQGFKNSMRVSFGAQYMPKTQYKFKQYDNINGTEYSVNKEFSYLKRITYRFGLIYAQSQLVVKNYQLTDKAITLGVGLPVGWNHGYPDAFSMVNIGVEIGYRGTTANELIKENYLKLSIGFTMNDKWFIKPKIN